MLLKKNINRHCPPLGSVFGWLSMENVASYNLVRLGSCFYPHPIIASTHMKTTSSMTLSNLRYSQKVLMSKSTNSSPICTSNVDLYRVSDSFMFDWFLFFPQPGILRSRFSPRCAKTLALFWFFFHRKRSSLLKTSCWSCKARKPKKSKFERGMRTGSLQRTSSTK